jgi:hypothetical protein
MAEQKTVSSEPSDIPISISGSGSEGEAKTSARRTTTSAINAVIQKITDTAAVATTTGTAELQPQKKSFGASLVTAKAEQTKDSQQPTLEVPGDKDSANASSVTRRDTQQQDEAPPPMQEGSTLGMLPPLPVAQGGKTAAIEQTKVTPRTKVTEGGTSSVSLLPAQQRNSFPLAPVAQVPFPVRASVMPGYSGGTPPAQQNEALLPAVSPPASRLTAEEFPDPPYPWPKPRSSRLLPHS